jgi:hypothetical protein
MRSQILDKLLTSGGATFLSSVRISFRQRNVNYAKERTEMKKTLLLMCVLAGMALASPKSFTVTLYEPSVIGGTELKAGDYKCELKDQKLVIKNGRETTEAGVKVETGEAKYASTSVRYNNGDGKMKVQEIRVGGTTMKLVLDQAGAAVSE